MSGTVNSVVGLSPCSKSSSSDCWVKFVSFNQSRCNFGECVNGCELCASLRLGHCHMLYVFLENTVIMVVEATETRRLMLIYNKAYFNSVNLLVCVKFDIVQMNCTIHEYHCYVKTNDVELLNEREIKKAWGKKGITKEEKVGKGKIKARIKAMEGN
jgi:hypothetical protein